MEEQKRPEMPTDIVTLLQRLVEVVDRIENHVDIFIRGERLPPRIQVMRARQKYIPDVDKLYYEYPRKLGKKRGFKTLLRDIKNEQDYYACGQAILNLKRICEKEHRAPEHIPYFSTFATNWRDYIPEEDFVKRHETMVLPKAEVDLLL